MNESEKSITKTLSENIKIACPECRSENIGQYRMLTGKIWCNDCGFSVPNKEVHNPFLTYFTLEAMDLADNLNSVVYNEYPSNISKTNSTMMSKENDIGESSPDFYSYRCNKCFNDGIGYLDKFCKHCGTEFAWIE